MSLLLTGSKTITIAGTEMQCIEVYMQESYTVPFAFTDSVGDPVNISTWTFTTAAKWYTCITIETATTIDIQNLVYINPQPSQPAGLTAAKIGGGTTGLGYLFLPTTLSGGSTETTPTYNSTTTLLCIVTMTTSRTDGTSGLTDINRIPVGVVVRYQ
jgi:hypothetical protein